MFGLFKKKNNKESAPDTKSGEAMDTACKKDESVQEDMSLPKDESVQEDMSLPKDESVQEDMSLPKDESVQEGMSLSKDESVQEGMSLPKDESVQEEECPKEESSQKDGMEEEKQEENVKNTENMARAGFFKRLAAGLTKTRNSIASGLESVFSSSEKIDSDFYDGLEEILVMADVGIKASDEILDTLKKKVKENKVKKPDDCRQLLKQAIIERMSLPDNAYDYENRKSVLLMIGVNGAGKTTSVGKIAGQLHNSGKKVIVAAADTFRAAAIEQLKVWTDRAGVEMISQAEGSDPAAVVFDAIQAFKSRNADVLICDTAGRLQNKKNLMDELNKIDRVITREYPECYRETLVVLDGTTGQNAMQQAKQFNDAAKVSGIVLTKLDGTAKGGIAIAIQNELGIPVKYIGVGEKIEDLQKFDAKSFVDALFLESDNSGNKEA